MDELSSMKDNLSCPHLTPAITSLASTRSFFWELELSQIVGRQEGGHTVTATAIQRSDSELELSQSDRDFYNLCTKPCFLSIKMTSLTSGDLWVCFSQANHFPANTDFLVSSLKITESDK